MSALVIQSHVKEGLEMAREAKLPLPIRQAIATHHGTKLIRYFFNKAQERKRPEKSGGARERLPLPRTEPQHQGDGHPAACRRGGGGGADLDNPTPTKIQAMIDRIFSNALEDDQLDDSRTHVFGARQGGVGLSVGADQHVSSPNRLSGFRLQPEAEKADSGPLQVGEKTVPANR